MFGNLEAKSNVPFWGAPSSSSSPVVCAQKSKDTFVKEATRKLWLRQPGCASKEASCTSGNNAEAMMRVSQGDSGAAELSRPCEGPGAGGGQQIQSDSFKLVTLQARDHHT